LRGHDRRSLTPRLEPIAGEPMTEGAIFVREHGIRRLAHEAVAKGELFFFRKSPGAATLDHLARDERVEPVVELGEVRDERADAATPEDFAEYARRAQHATRVGLEPLDAPLHHREHRLGEVVALG